MKRAAALLVLAALAAWAAGGCAKREGQGGSSVDRELFRQGARYVLRSRLDPRRVTLGDPARWTLSAELPQGARVDTLALTPHDSTLDVWTAEADARGAGARERGAFVQSYTIRAFDLGAVALPAGMLYARRGTVQDTLEFPGDTIQVDSLSPASTGAIEPERGPLPTELRPIDVALAVALGLLTLGALVAAIVLFLRARRARRVIETAVSLPDPPDVILLREIDALRVVRDTLPRDRFHDRLSFAVRRYIAAVTPVEALDRTTREIERELSALPHGGVDAAHAVGRVLRKSDLVKFARAGDAAEEAGSALDEATLLPKRFQALGLSSVVAGPAAGPDAAAPQGAAGDSEG